MTLDVLLHRLLDERVDDAAGRREVRVEVSDTEFAYYPEQFAEVADVRTTLARCGSVVVIST